MLCDAQPTHRAISISVFAREKKTRSILNPRTIHLLRALRKVGVDFWADESAENFWIDNVIPCSCAASDPR
jgi:hypothetical protein